MIQPEITSIRSRNEAVERECCVIGSWVGPFEKGASYHIAQAAHEDRRELLEIIDDLNSQLAEALEIIRPFAQVRTKEIQGPVLGQFGDAFSISILDIERVKIFYAKATQGQQG